jgi:hypothetical protein
MVPLLLLSVTVTIAETASRWIVQCTAETNLLLESTYVQSVQTQCDPRGHLWWMREHTWRAAERGAF